MLTPSTKWATRRGGRVGLAIAAAAALWPAAVALAGPFLDCQDISPDRDQIIVGDVGLATGTDPDDARIALDDLHENLRQALADLTTSLGGAVYSVPCPGHFPERSDYNPGIVERRFQSGVLVEVWGVVGSTKAEVKYALLPLLPPVGGNPPDGFYDLRYTIKPPEGIAEIFADPVELRAFTELSAGLRALAAARAKHDGARYGRAYTALCKADGLLAKAKDAGPKQKGRSTTADWDALRQLAKASANAAKAEAATADAAGAGALTQPLSGVSLGDCGVPPPDPLVSTGGSP